MIRRRDPGNFGVYPLYVMLRRPWEPLRGYIDQIAGPVIISALLFFAILANFILRGALRFPSDGYSA